MIAVSGFILTHWKALLTGLGAIAVAGFILLAFHWKADAAQAHADLLVANKALKACKDQSAALVAQIHAQAVEEGKRYEKTEADHLAACHDAYVAGAKRLRDDKAIAAGRYVPKSGSSVPKR